MLGMQKLHKAYEVLLKEKGLKYTFERKTVSSEELFCGGDDEIWINHSGTFYRLSKTKAGKLILTK